MQVLLSLIKFYRWNDGAPYGTSAVSPMIISLLARMSSLSNIYWGTSIHTLLYFSYANWANTITSGNNGSLKPITFNIGMLVVD